MLIQEDHLNATENYVLCEPERIDLADTYMGEDATVGTIYRESMKLHGRCTGKVYIDTDGKPRAIGWVFVKREKYEDTGETFLHETWVTLLTKYEPRIEIEYADVVGR